MNKTNPGKFIIVLADDDEDDQMMVASAFKDAGLEEPVIAIENGEELMHYLQKTGKYTGTPNERPHLILLDLNMPKKDGRTALKEIKSDPQLSKIPVVIFSTSNNVEDISTSYANGANSFISKPSSYQELVEIAGILKTYWQKTVKQA
jgi:CheY-like chemotaxis protein